MAGSEKSGLDGVDKDLFQDATWVLTPSELTDTDAYMQVRNIVSSFGAGVVTVDSIEHDHIVATISHVPHLIASALMTGALTTTQDNATVLRLAAGGFHDMTRIAAGSAELWTDIVEANRAAIGKELDRLAEQLSVLRKVIGSSDLDELKRFLAAAAEARQQMPKRSGRPQDLTFIRIPIADRTGALAEALTVFSNIRVNIEDLEIAHDIKGDRGVLQVTIASDQLDTVRAAFETLNIRISLEGS